MVPRLILCSVFLFLLSLSAAHAATINAANCNQATVQSAVTTAAVGDTVQLPTCNVTNWTDSGVTITKAIILRGEGSAVGDPTQTRVGLANDGNCGGTLFLVDGPAFITGFEMHGIILEGSQSGTIQKYEIGLKCRDCIDFKIHDNLFTHLGVGVEIAGNALTVKGVVYDNRFINLNLPGGQGCSTHGYGVEVQGNADWGSDNPVTLGTQNAIYIEDNTFDFVRHSVASNNASRYVFRYNIITNSARQDAAPVDTHGQEGSWARGSRSFEVYNNTIQGNTFHASNNKTAVGIRGGDGVIYNNVSTRVNHSANFNVAPLGNNGNGGCSLPYPYTDQTRKAHVWGNTPNSVGIEEGCEGHIVQGRDYFTTSWPGYTALVYPHPLRDDPPSTVPGPPLLVHIAPIP